MCLRAQEFDNDDGGVARGRQAQGLSNNDGGVGGLQGIDDASDRLETKMEAARIIGRQQRLRRRDDRPHELVTTTEALAEEYDPEDFTMIMEASAKEAGKTALRTQR